MFRDRVDAARQLAARVSSLRDENVVVLGLPRGGVPLAAVVAETLGVAYAPERESGNFVPTTMGERYDALIWCERTRALTPLHREPRPSEPELETEPTGY